MITRRFPVSDIPYRERGYAVERATLIVHERYPDHSPGALRTSPQGMANIVGARGVACPVCFPPPPVARKRDSASTVERFRAAITPEPATVTGTGTVGDTVNEPIVEPEPEDASE